jgi:hypothetical protein
VYFQGRDFVYLFLVLVVDLWIGVPRFVFSCAGPSDGKRKCVATFIFFPRSFFSLSRCIIFWTWLVFRVDYFIYLFIFLLYIRRRNNNDAFSPS